MDKDMEIQILSNFKGAMIGEYSLENEKIFLKLKKEKPTVGYKNEKFDYNLHFNFGLLNPTNKKKEISIFIECKKESELTKPITWLWISDNFKKEYKITKDIIGKTDFHGKYYFNITLASKEEIYIANFPPKDFQSIEKEFSELSLKVGAKEVKVGKTIQERYIKAYEIGEVIDKPTIFFVSGFHPPERDTIAINAIMSKFLDKGWKEEILKKYSFSFIPILNPDGFANIMQGSNINEVNFHWKFFGNLNKVCPEAHSIWEYCTKIKPIIFFDFHAFTFQNNNPRPYWIPEGYYISKKASYVQSYINKKLSQLCKNNHSKNEVILAPTLLATRLRNELGTITSPKFHLHMKDGIEKSSKMAINCFDIVIEGLNKYDIISSEEILLKPYGKVKARFTDKLRIKILNFKFLKLIPLLKKILR
jgi:hypothetical protein